MAFTVPGGDVTVERLSEDRSNHSGAAAHWAAGVFVLPSCRGGAGSHLGHFMVSVGAIFEYAEAAAQCGQGTTATSICDITLLWQHANNSPRECSDSLVSIASSYIGVSSCVMQSMLPAYLALCDSKAMQCERTVREAAAEEKACDPYAAGSLPGTTSHRRHILQTTTEHPDTFTGSPPGTTTGTSPGTTAGSPPGTTAGSTASCSSQCVAYITKAQTSDRCLDRMASIQEVLADTAHRTCSNSKL